MAKVVIEGTEYGSRSEAARALIAKGGFTTSQIAKMVGMTPQTVYVQTPEGMEKVKIRKAKYKTIAMATTGQYTENMISEKLGVEKALISKIVSFSKSDLTKIVEPPPKTLLPKISAKRKVKVVFKIANKISFSLFFEFNPKKFPV